MRVAANGPKDTLASEEKSLQASKSDREQQHVQDEDVKTEHDMNEGSKHKQQVDEVNNQTVTELEEGDIISVYIETLKLDQQGNPIIQPVVKWLNGKPPTKNETNSCHPATRILWKHKDSFTVIEGVLYKRLFQNR